MRVHQMLECEKKSINHRKRFRKSEKVLVSHGQGRNSKGTVLE